jgi:hypothetical protein
MDDDAARHISREGLAALEARPRRKTNRGCPTSAWSSGRSLGSRTPRQNSSSAPMVSGLVHCAISGSDVQ